MLRYCLSLNPVRHFSTNTGVRSGMHKINYKYGAVTYYILLLAPAPRIEPM